MSTSHPLLSPSDLAIPPDIDVARPLCPCGAVPIFPCVGMHGDGLTYRKLAWPVLGDDGALADIVWLIAVGRRYKCPACGKKVRVAHPGVQTRGLYAVPAIAALLHVVAAVPFGRGSDDSEAYQLARGDSLPASERARSGRPRWTTLRRWMRSLHLLWAAQPLPEARPRERLHALLAGFGLGMALDEVLGVAVVAHARGGLAM